MQVLNKLKEAAVSVLPIMGIVGLLHLTIAPIEDSLPAFLVGGVLLIIGLSIFLLGAEIGLVPIGQKTGAALTAKRSLPLMILAGLAVGFFATVAEPDVQVLATQVVGVAPDISPNMLIMMIGIGVGGFVAVAVVRSVLRFSLKILLLVFYLLVFGCAWLTDPAFLGIAFDAGGATTGPLTVPFIMALGVGIASSYGRNNADGDQSFGFVGLSSIGPVLAVLLLGIFLTPGSNQAAAAATSAQPLSLGDHFLTLLPEIVHEVLMALGPLAALCVLFQFTLLHLPPIQLARVIVGFVYTFVGLVIFFLGAKGGFIPAGTELGGQLATTDGGVFLIPVGVLLGALVVCAEPAVWVLNEQVEQASGGHIRARVMLVSLSIGVACAVGIAMFRVWQGVSLWWFLIPGYIITFVLTRFCPDLFTAIAFDSGGVASGPMASTFILSFTLGASSATGGNPATDAFGVIAMIAMTPLITIQILGMLYARKRRAAEAQKHIAETSL